MSTINIVVRALVCTTIASISPTARAAEWTRWISEEAPNTTTCAENLEQAAALGFGCSGDHCDNVQLLCETLPFGAALNSNTAYWTEFFSEEGNEESTFTSEGWYRFDSGNYEVCHAFSGYPGFVVGIRCKGDDCDDISLACVQATKNGLPVNAVGCSWSGWLSEEERSVDFGVNNYITGVECRGDYCDDKRFLVCSMVDPDPSCVPIVTCGGQCGLVADGCGGTLNCPECCEPQCDSRQACGISDGCGGTCFGKCSRGFSCDEDHNGRHRCVRPL